MAGFFGLVTNEKNKMNRDLTLSDIVEQDEHLLQNEDWVTSKAFNGIFFQNAVSKFVQDKVFYQDQDFFIILDGVILNKQELFKKYCLHADEEMVKLIKLMASTATDFFKEFRGTFAGVYFDKKKSTFILFTNHIGDKEVFYHVDNQVLYFATDFLVLVQLIQKNCEKKMIVNRNTAYAMLTHGHALCNETLVEDIHRLTPGHSLQYTKNNLVKNCYYQLSNQPTAISEQAAIEKLDNYFRNAVKLSFEKDLEYGYRHLVALSGGLDSRMTTWVANDMGYRNMVNYTFSQTGYLDQKVARQITNHLKTEWIFKSLDNGIYLYRYFEEAIRLGGGRCQSATLAHTLSMMKNLNLSEFGLIHTGQLGDVILGTYYEKGKCQKFKIGDGAVSKKMMQLVHYSKENSYAQDDQELFKFYNRGFTGINAGLKPMYQYTETISPFMDIEFLDFCLSLPLDYRKAHHIYIKWIKQCYPGAANFIYEKVNGKINRKTITINGIPVPWTSIPYVTLKGIKKKMKMQHFVKSHMNPHDYW